MAVLLIRLGLETGADPFGVPQTAAAPAAMRGLTPRDFDARAFQQSVLSPVLCGQYWSGEIERGLAALAGADVLHIWYEDLLRQPVASIGRIVAFITGEAKPGFVAAAASIVRAPRSTWRELPEDEAWLLESVCQAGYAALARYGIAPTVVGNPR
jgi:putative sulfotransferase